MKLTIFNGSPKPGKNNTGILLERFVEAFTKQAGNEARVYRLNQLGSLTEAVSLFETSEVILIAYPLYYFAMPGGVKQFYEALEPLCGKCGHQKIAFLVQYGFIEAIHARPLEKYHIKLAKLLGCQYLGTIIKGGCDGLASAKGWSVKKILDGMDQIGLTFGETGELNPHQLLAFSAPEVEKGHSGLIMKGVLKLINKYYWGKMLKKNGVTVEASFAKPYQVEK
jgi:hypothetical protein